VPSEVRETINERVAGLTRSNDDSVEFHCKAPARRNLAGNNTSGERQRRQYEKSRGIANPIEILERVNEISIQRRPKGHAWVVIRGNS
jgi:hypothetical protein